MLTKTRRLLCLLIIFIIFALSIYNFFVLILSLDSETDLATKIVRNVDINQKNLHTNQAGAPVIQKRKGKIRAVAARQKLTKKNETIGKKTKKLRSNKAAEEEEAISNEKIISSETKAKIFWPKNVAAVVSSKSTSINRCQNFSKKVKRPLAALEPSTWDKCGRPNNAFATFDDGTSFCIRHRYPHNYLIAGELLAFHLGSYLGINIPCVALSDTSDLIFNQGAKIWPSKLSWKQNTTVALIEWKSDLKVNSRIPATIVNAVRKRKTINHMSISGKPFRQRVQLARWAQLIIFDFITGHHDRYARLLDDSEKQNDTSIMSSIVPNVGTDEQGNFWLFDNEPSLLDAYQLLYEVNNPESARFLRFHNLMLSTICVFDKNLLVKISRLYQQDDPVEYLLTLAREKEPNLDKLNLDEKYGFVYLKKYFKTRLASVIDQAKRCSEAKFD